MRKTISLKNMIEYENLNKANRPYFEEFNRAFREVLDSGWFILGENVKEFEREFADYNNVKNCAGVASGLDALILSLKALALPERSEIIVPSNTYIATILSIIHSGHIPVLVEPELDTYNIDPGLIEDAITSRTRAILVVHLYGKPCDMDPIMEICKNKKLFLVEDCAQAHGAEYKGKKVGTFGDLAAFSFYPTKNLGCLGDGGAVVTSNRDFDLKVRMLRNYGSEKKYHNEFPGINSRLDEIQAAFLRIKLKHLDEINKHKRRLAELYSSGLDEKIIKPVIRSGCLDVFHIYPIRHSKRDKLRSYLLSKEIKTEIHYPVPPNNQRALPILQQMKCPISEMIHSTIISLPISSIHTESEVQKVIEEINRFVFIN